MVLKQWHLSASCTLPDGRINEGIRHKRLTFLSDGADMKHLAACFDVRVITANHLALACKVCIGQIVEVQVL